MVTILRTERHMTLLSPAIRRRTFCRGGRFPARQGLPPDEARGCDGRADYTSGAGWIASFCPGPDATTRKMTVGRRVRHFFVLVASSSVGQGGACGSECDAHRHNQRNLTMKRSGLNLCAGAHYNPCSCVDSCGQVNIRMVSHIFRTTKFGQPLIVGFTDADPYAISEDRFRFGLRHVQRDALPPYERVRWLRRLVPPMGRLILGVESSATGIRGSACVSGLASSSGPHPSRIG